MNAESARVTLIAVRWAQPLKPHPYVRDANFVPQSLSCPHVPGHCGHFRAGTTWQIKMGARGEGVIKSKEEGRHQFEPNTCPKLLTSKKPGNSIARFSLANRAKQLPGGYITSFLYARPATCPFN